MLDVNPSNRRFEKTTSGDITLEFGWFYSINMHIRYLSFQVEIKSKIESNFRMLWPVNMNMKTSGIKSCQLVRLEG